MDTIFALASAPGRAGVSVIRISGPGVKSGLARFGVTLPDGGRGLRRLMDGKEPVDEALCLHFPEGRSFTGEEVAELHLHGSIAIVRRVIACLSEVPDLRLAEAGEFSRRAFENGKLDLSQIEGLSDLIDAETELQRKQALRVLSGDLGRRADEWRGELIRIAALFTAGIDFADEEIPEDVILGITDDLRKLSDSFSREITRGRAAESIRSGFEVAIVGRPNAGKSTLLNRLAGREAALASEVAGTTRDVIEVRMEIAGLPITLLDTAGLRSTDDRIEAMGVERAIKRAKQADLRIFLQDGDNQVLLVQPEDGDLTYFAKGDLRDDSVRRVSGLTGEGVDLLVEDIADVLGQRVSDSGVTIRERHRRCLMESRGSVDEARSILEQTGDDVLAAELVLTAARQMDALVGRIDVEAILGDIFSNFCVGK